MSSDSDFTLPIPRQVKVAVLGTWAVGKTALLTRYTQQRFEEDYKPSKSDTFSFDVTVAGEEIHLGVWDTAGRSKQGADDTRLVLPQTDVGIVCFALTRPHSVIMARRFAAMLREVAGPKSPIVFAGCESDLVQFCNAETTKWSTPAIDLKALRASGGLSAARDLTDVVDDDLSLAPAVVTQEDIDELLAEFGPEHVTYRACSAATGDGVDDLMRQVIMRGLIRAKQRERDLMFADAAPPDAAATDAAPVDESAFDAATSDTTDDEAVDLSVSMPDVSRGRDLCADPPKRKIATSFDVSDAGVLSNIMADSMIDSLKRFGDAVKNNKATVTPAPPPLVADPRDQTALALVYLFSTADCFHCKRRIEFGELRHHCFEDECPQRVDICSPCLKQHGHVHRTFAERVWLPADMSWRLSGRSAVHTFLNCMHFFSTRPAVGRPVHDSGGRCVRYEWLTYGELFQRSCLLVVALRCPPTDNDDDTSSDDDDDDDDDDDEDDGDDSDPLDLSAIRESLRAREVAARITPAQRRELAALLAPGAFVGLLSENRRQFYSVDLGCQLCGLVTVPIHTAYNTATMAHVLDDSGVVALFCTHTQLAAAVAAARLAHKCKVRFFVVIDDDDVSDGAARAALVAAAGAAANGVASVLLLGELTAALDARLAYGRFYENWKARDLFALSYTSGSTGTPKGVMECAEHFQQKPSANTVSYRMRGSSCLGAAGALAAKQRLEPPGVRRAHRRLRRPDGQRVLRPLARAAADVVFVGAAPVQRRLRRLSRRARRAPDCGERAPVAAAAAVVFVRRVRPGHCRRALVVPPVQLGRVRAVRAVGARAARPRAVAVRRRPQADARAGAALARQRARGEARRQAGGRLCARRAAQRRRRALLGRRQRGERRAGRAADVEVDGHRRAAAVRDPRLLRRQAAVDHDRRRADGAGRDGLSARRLHRRAHHEQLRHHRGRRHHVGPADVDDARRRRQADRRTRARLPLDRQAVAAR
jgi:small GTP-binding protein